MNEADAIDSPDADDETVDALVGELSGPNSVSVRERLVRAPALCARIGGSFLTFDAVTQVWWLKSVPSQLARPVLSIALRSEALTVVLAALEVVWALVASGERPSELEPLCEKLVGSRFFTNPVLRTGLLNRPYDTLFCETKNVSLRRACVDAWIARRERPPLDVSLKLLAHESDDVRHHAVDWVIAYGAEGAASVSRLLRSHRSDVRIAASRVFKVLGQATAAEVDPGLA